MPPVRTLVVYLIFLLSGVAGIGYQMVWTRLFTVGLGHEAPSMLAVVAGFFAGLALGAWLLDRAVSRAAHPGRWYAGLECVIGAWGVATTVLIPWAGARAAPLMGIAPAPLFQWLVSFAIPFLVLLPATSAMGATLPAIDRVVARLRTGGRAVAGLYAVNTLGAVFGVLISTFYLIPTHGLRRTVFALAACNALCGVGALLVMRTPPGPSVEPKFAPPPPAPQHRARPKHTPAPAPQPLLPTRTRLLTTLLVTGLLGIGFEVLAVIVMAQAMHDTVYTFAMALTTYLLGTALGAALYHAVARHLQFTLALSWLLLALAVTCLAGVLTLAGAPAIMRSATAGLGATYAGAIAAEGLVAALVFLPPTLVMGATFSHLCLGLRTTTGGVGAALGINTLGGCLAPPLFGVLLLPLLGAKFALVLLSACYLALLPRPSARLLAVLPLALFLGAGACLVDLRHVTPPGGGGVAEFRQSVMGAVAVVTDPQGARYLKVNNRFQMGATISTFAERRLMLLPMLLHPSPRRTLVLGLGTGVTIGAAASDPGMHTDGVELLPDIVRVMRRFAPENNAPFSKPSITIRTADARRFVRAAPDSYDLIVADLFHPARDGAGTLYTREHFAAVRARLAEGGLFVQWLPLYQLDLEMFSVICRTYMEVFPDAMLLLAHFNTGTPMLGLLSRPDHAAFSADQVLGRVKTPVLGPALNDVAIENELDVLGCFIADARSLRAFVDRHSPAGLLNTDDAPVVIYRAPRLEYTGGAAGSGQGIEAPSMRLGMLIYECSADPGAVLDATSAASRAEQLRRFQTARNLFLDAAIANEHADAHFAEQRLLAAVRACPAFRPAYAQALALARARAASDPEAARALLQALIDADPSRPEARQLLQQLSRQINP